MRVTKRSLLLQPNQAFLLLQNAWGQTSASILMTSFILAGSAGTAIAQTASWAPQATQVDCSGTSAYDPNGSAGAEVLPCQSYAADLYENWDPTVQGTGDTDIETYAAGYDGNFFYFRFDMRQDWNYDNSGVSRNYYLDVEADAGVAGGDNRADFFVRYDPSTLHVGTAWVPVGQVRGFIYGDENNDVGCGNLGLNDAKGCSTGYVQDITLQSSDFYVRIIGDKIEFALKASLFGSKQQIRSRGYATQTSTLSPDKLYWHDANDASDLSSFRFDYSAGGDPAGWIVSGVGVGTVSISGTVFDDADGSKLQNGAEIGSNGGGLNAVLVNNSNQVVATTAVAANGTYSFSNIPANATYTVQITTANATVGAAPPAVTLPAGWVSTGENLNSTIDGTVDSKLSVAVTTSNVTGANLGIEQLPNTNAVNATSQSNPGGTTQVIVPALSGTDPEDGALGTGKNFKIVTLPTNGTLYYNGIAVTAGQVITNYDSTKLTVDPNDGAVTVSFTYAAIDTASKEDSTPATVSMSFTSAITTPNYCSIVYGIDNSGAAFSKIYTVNTTNATYTLAQANSGANATNTNFLSAAAAIQSSTGRLYYISRDTSGTDVAYWNPATNTHTTLAQTFNAGSTTIRAAFSPDGRLFTATSTTLFEINPSTGALISSKPLSGVSGANGDMAFDGNGVLFLAADANLYAINVNTLSSSSPATLVATAPVGTQFNSLAFTSDGKLYAHAGSNRTVYEVNTNTGALTSIGLVTFNPAVAATVVGTDFASCAQPTPNIKLSKTVQRVGGTGPVQPGDTLEYTVTILNDGLVSATAARFQDAIPAGTTYVPNSTTMNGTAFPDNSGFPFANGQVINSPGLQSGVLGYGSTYQIVIKYRVTVNTTNPPTSVSNQGTFSYFGVPPTIQTDDPSTPAVGDATVIAIASAAVVNVSGTVFSDADGSVTINGSDVGTHAESANLTIYAIDTAGRVVDKATVAANGTYSLTNVPQNSSVTLRLSNDSTVAIGSPAPTSPSLPSNWVNTGENKNGTTETVTPGDIAVTTTTTNITNQNFGIEQLPNTTNLTAVSQTNPGETATIQVPTLAGTDLEDGALGSGKTFKIVALPTNGTLTYNTVAVTAGQVITNYDPTLLTLDPNDGAITVSFTYAAIDTAGKEDPTPATVSMPFTAPTADLSVTKTDGQTTTTPGSPIGYTITVTNNGPNSVTSLTLTDTLPASIQSPIFTPSTGIYNSSTGAWTGLNLASGQSITLTVNGTVSASAVGTITNTATVAPPSGTTDPTPANNTATDTTNVYAVSPQRIVINEVLYAQTGATSDSNDEFIELYNASAATVDLSNWQLGDGNLIDNTTDGVGSITGSSSNPAYIFPVGTTLAPGQYAVIWIGDNTADHQATGATFQTWLGQTPKLNNTGDDIWLYDAQTQIVDYVAYGSGSAINTPPPASFNLWDSTYQSSLAGASAGQSISLTPNGQDGNISACWEPATSGQSSGRCTGYLPTRDTDTVGSRVNSVGVNNNGTVATLPPNLLLVKRITAINGVDVTSIVDDPGSTNDNAVNWPLPLNGANNISTYLRGAIDGGIVRPNDTLEYTIYFLSDGGSPATNVNLCDLVPANSTFISNSFSSTPASGISLALGTTTTNLTNVPDGDAGHFLNPGAIPAVTCSAANTNGAVMVEIVKSPVTLPNATAPGTPTNSYGFIRFKVRIN